MTCGQTPGETRDQEENQPRGHQGSQRKPKERKPTNRKGKTKPTNQPTKKGEDTKRTKHSRKGSQRKRKPTGLQRFVASSNVRVCARPCELLGVVFFFFWEHLPPPPPPAEDLCCNVLLLGYVLFRVPGCRIDFKCPCPPPRPPTKDLRPWRSCAMGGYNLLGACERTCLRDHPTIFELIPIYVIRHDDPRSTKLYTLLWMNKIHSHQFETMVETMVETILC